MLRILHFADAHIDMANYGRHDPVTGLPFRVLDFLKSLDTIVDTAIAEVVDLVIFAGDAYKDRTPAPTYQREWGQRIMRLSRAGIPTLLLIGNHDVSPSMGRAHAIQEFETLEVPNVRVLAKPQFLSAADLGLPLQVIALPWVSRSGLLAALELSAADPAEVYREIESRLTALVQNFIEGADPDLPLLLTAHASVQGAIFGGERAVMLGNDLVLPASLVRDPRLDYTALGHIHKPQNLNPDAHPPAIYPGSIERVDFGEIDDERFFVIASVSRGHTEVDWRRIEGIRRFISHHITLDSDQGITGRLLCTLGPAEGLEGAIVRLVVEYPRQWDPLLDEASLRQHAAGAFEFHLVKRPQMEARLRLPQDQTISSLTPLDLLDKYWLANHTSPEESVALQTLARQLMADSEEGSGG
jgi:exonuclease SbcD